MNITSRSALCIAAAMMLPAHAPAMSVVGKYVENLPLSISNSIVQIKNNAGGTGTGEVVAIVPAAAGGEYLDILTADHVVRDGFGIIDNAPSIVTTFANARGGGGSWAGTNITSDFTIPNPDGTSAVDLALYSIYLPGPWTNQLPAGLTALSLTKVAAKQNDAIIQAGYGNEGTVTNATTGNFAPFKNVKTPAFVYSPLFNFGQGFGTLVAGDNTVGNTPRGMAVFNSTFMQKGAAVPYTFDALTGGTNLAANATGGYDGTTYLMGGDSGGPTFEVAQIPDPNNPGAMIASYSLYGVHSASVTTRYSGNLNDMIQFDVNSQIGAPQAADPNYLWYDVDVSSYTNWITTAEALVNVPEPTTAGLLAAAIGLLGRRRERCD